MVCIINTFAAFALSYAGVLCAQTQTNAAYPNKPIRLIVPFAPGGGTNIIARLIGLELTGTSQW